MNKRTLKKNMNYLTQELMAECLWIVHYQKNANIEDVENIIDSILIMQSEMLSRVSHPYPNNAKQYFKKLRADFIRQTEEIIEQITNLS